MSEVEIKVMGNPVPQGSTRAFIKNGRPIITSANRNLKAWRQRIATEAQAKRPELWDMEVAMAIEIDFLMPRPKSMPKKIIDNIKRPDIDKLIRAVLDGLTDIFFSDDSQVIHIVATKRYAEKDMAPGAFIKIKHIEHKTLPDTQ